MSMYYTQPYDFCIPDDEPECPDEYIAKARKQLLADNDWLANVISESIDALTAEMLMDANCASDAERNRAVCERLRAAVNAAVESESGDLAEKMWMSDVEESHQAAAEYSRGDY